MLRDHYIFSNGRLKRKNNTIYFENEQGASIPLPVEKIRTLHIFGEVDINSKLINFINQHDIFLQFYNYYGFYSGTFCPRDRDESGYIIVCQSKNYLNEEKRLYLASQFVTGAIYHILRNLRKYKLNDSEEFLEIERIGNSVKYVDNIPSLMGMEGLARKYYYKCFNDVLKQDFAMEKRTKRPPRDPVNALISFGNTLMYQVVLSEIYKTPLNPTVSFLHEPSTKRYSLCLDIAEIFKPLIVDSLIFTLINKKVITKKHFEYLDGEACFLNETGRKKFIEAWEECLRRTIKHRTLRRSVSYRYLVRLEGYKLIKHIIGEETYKPLRAWW